MAKNTSGVISGMGVGMSIIQALVKEVQEKGGTDEDIRYLATPEGEKFLAYVASRLVAYRRESAAVSKFRVNIDEQAPVGSVPAGPGFLF